MLFSINHPELLPHLKILGYGLMPVLHAGAQRYSLVMKVTKEMILTARLNGEFKVYLLRDKAPPRSYLGIITAFFDDPDEPLTIKSPQFMESDLLVRLTGLLCQTEFDIYFFDEHDRELMGVHAHNADSSRFKAEIEKANFISCDRSSFPDILRRLEHRFAVRDTDDDASAFTITLGQRLYPDDIVLIDARDDVYRFQSAETSIAATSLEREQPGPSQERDIAVMLGRVFDGECIYLNPLNDDTGKELTDVMIIDDQIMMFIQAKDSPNTEAALRRSIDRKRSATRSHIDKASKQLRGALSNAARAGSVIIRTGQGSVKLPVGDRQLLGLVIVREMFDDDYVTCSKPVIDVMQVLHLPTVLLDYSGFHLMALNLRTPTEFINGLGKMVEIALEKNEYPKPVFFGRPSSDTSIDKSA